MFIESTRIRNQPPLFRFKISSGDGANKGLIGLLLPSICLMDGYVSIAILSRFKQPVVSQRDLFQTL
jgi:hypothetical protein